ncbi:MAG: hypothetical protein R3Y60_01975 [bacterium]
MKILFKSLEIENFMSYDKFDIDFDDVKTTLRGFNGAGKTTILNAICWCLFKKDYYDRSKFDLKPIKDGVSQEELETKVALIFSVDGNENVIERINKKGLNTTKVNGAVFKEKEYLIYVQETLGINEEDFKLIANPNYAIGLNWKDLRNIVFGYVGEVKDEDIFNEEPSLKPLANKIETMGIEKVRQGVMSNISDIKNKMLPELNGKIQLVEDEVTHLESVASTLTEKQEQLTKIDSQIENYMKIVENENNKKNEKQKLLNDISKLNNKIDTFEIEKKNLKVQGEQINLEIKSKTNIEELRSKDILEQQSKIQKFHISLQGQLSRFNGLKEDYTLYEEEIKKISEEVVRVESEVCPTCNKPLTEEEIKISLQNLELLKENKIKERKEINERTKTMLLDLKEKISFEKEEFNKEKELLEEIKVRDYTHLIEENFELTTLNQNKEKLLEDYNRLDVEIKQCGLEIDKINISIEEIPAEEQVGDYRDLVEQRDDLALQLQDVSKFNESKDLLVKLTEDKLELEKKYKQSEVALELVKKYQSIKSKKTEEALRNYFNDISFITQEIAKNGKTEETFKVYLGGRPYETLSGGEKMRSQLDLLNGIQKLKSINMPVLIDSISELDKMPEYINSQLVTCLTVQKPKEDSENFEKYKKAFTRINVVKG